MSPEEIAFFEAAKPVIYRFWRDENKNDRECPYNGCYGDGGDPFKGECPDDGISFNHSKDCALKDAMLAYWAMQESKVPA